MFFHIIPKRLRYIGGVGKMGWVEADTLEVANKLSLPAEAELLGEADVLVPKMSRCWASTTLRMDSATERRWRRGPSGMLCWPQPPSSAESVLPEIKDR